MLETQKSTICFKSRTIGAIEGAFYLNKMMNNKSIQFYIELCNELNYEGDESILEYLKEDYHYKYIDGKHTVQI